MTDTIENEELTGPTYSTPYLVDLFGMQNDEELIAYVDLVRSLPKPIYFILTDQTTARIINEKIAPQFNLDPEQTLEVTRVVRDVLISTLFVGDLVVNLSQRLQVDEARGQQIANALIGGVFESAMEDIRSLQVQYFPDRVGQPQVKDNTVNLRN